MYGKSKRKCIADSTIIFIFSQFIPYQVVTLLAKLAIHYEFFAFLARSNNQEEEDSVLRFQLCGHVRCQVASYLNKAEQLS